MAADYVFSGPDAVGLLGHAGRQQLAGINVKPVDRVILERRSDSLMGRHILVTAADFVS